MICVDLQDDEDAEELFRSEEWCAQELLRGIWCRVAVGDNGVTAWDRNGNPVFLSNGTLGMLPTKDCLLDGRLLRDTFTAFDVLMAGTYAERLAALIPLAVHEWMPVPTVYTALGEKAKRELHHRVKDAGDEGIVFKRLASSYVAGRSADVIRLKNWRSETFRVERYDTLTDALLLRTLDNEPAGPVSAGRWDPAPGALIQVRYSKKHRSGTLDDAKVTAVRNDS